MPSKRMNRSGDAESSSNVESSVDSIGTDASTKNQKTRCLKDAKCLKKTTCLKDTECLKKKPCLKDVTSSQSQGESGTDTSTESCLKTRQTKKKNKNKKLRKNAVSEFSESSEATATSTSAGGACVSISDSESKASKSSSKATSKIDTTSQSGGASHEVTSDTKSSKSSKSSKASKTDTSTNAAVSSDDQRSPWTLSDDCALRGMKEAGDGLTWTEIATTLGINKDEVRACWKVIKDQSALAATHKEEKVKEKAGKKNKESVDNKHKETTKNKSSKKAESKGQENAPAPTENQKKAKKAKSGAPKKEHKSEKEQIAVQDNKPTEKKTAEVYQYDLLSGEEASSEFSTSNDDQYDPEEEEYRQNRYLHKEIYSQLYPGYINIEPDEYFSPQDCRVLATAESKYQRSKWLEMQANFYNVTGRMVPLELIRAKCERGEKENRAAERAHEGTVDKQKRVRDWVSQVPDEEYEDTES
ncbi:hypothetical protein PT974_06594 [Cladobotryum mycophilum]|uniref:Myb-like domain-containing protein n=1 Tax=Cladobotryum mycophilum TaxID=491253 RepID=A0ABR0SMZ9_9HYPO